MSTIKELWYGNIQPQEQLRQNSEELKALAEYIQRHRTTLMASLNDEQKDIFQRYIDCHEEYAQIFEPAIFELGFTLGAQFMLEMITNEEDTP